MLSEPKYGDKYILELETIQTSHIRTIFEVLKDTLLSDFDIVFTPTFIKVVEMDGKEKCCVHLKLTTYDEKKDKEMFEHYYCDKGPIKVGLNATDFFKIIKTAKNTDTIAFYIDKKHPDEFIVQIENTDKDTILESSVKILDNCKEQIDIPSLDYSSHIEMSSSDFQKNIRNMNSLCCDNLVKITNIGSRIIFEYNAHRSKQKVIIGKNTGDNISDQIIMNTFEVHFLLLFTKATNLSETVSIYMKQDEPLILGYNIGSLGSLKFLLEYVNTNKI